MKKFLTLLLLSQLCVSLSFAITITKQWATYFGDIGFEDIRSIATGPDGSVYITGSTTSLDNIATPGAFQTISGGGTNMLGNDAFIARFSPEGSPLWATYFGGTQTDVGSALAIDPSGNIYLCGWTASDTGIVTPGCYQPIRAGAWGGADRFDAYLAKFDSSGNRLWATYVGGGSDGFSNSPLSVTTDMSGAVYLALTTESTDFLTTAGAYQSSNAGLKDAYLIKFSGSGNRIFATYFGGEDEDFVSGIAVDDNSNIYATGYTASSTGIASASAWQPTAGGNQDAFLFKFAATGARQWSTYLGGTGLDRAYGLTTDGGGKVYIAGLTTSDSGMATNGSFQQSYGGSTNGDGFVAAFDSAGVRKWSSYFGSGESDLLWSVDYNNNRLLLGGYTSSDTGIATLDGMQTSFSGVTDGIISMVDTSGTTKLWSSYIGGLDIDQVKAAVFDSSGNVYLAGNTTSATGIATPGAYQIGFGGGVSDGFLLKLQQCPVIDTPVIIATGYLLSLTHAYLSYQWYKDNVAIAGATGPTYTVTESGSYSVQVNNYPGCDTLGSVSVNINVTRINDPHAEGYAVIPNPAADHIQIIVAEESQIFIYSLDGKLMLNGSIPQGSSQVSLKSIADGIYLSLIHI